MKTYLINLDRNPERLTRMHDILSALGVEYERVAAVDGRNSSAVDSLNTRRLSPAEKGCLLSHREAWRRIADGDEPYAAVLEDDLLISSAFAKFAKSSSWIPADADLIKLETTGRSVALSETQPLSDSEHSVAHMNSAHLGAAGYIISSAAAERLLRSPIARDWPADDILFDPRLARRIPLLTYQLLPAVCRQAPRTEVASVIRDDRSRYHRKPSVAFLHTVEKTVKRLNRQLVHRRALKNGSSARSVPFA